MKRLWPIIAVGVLMCSPASSMPPPLALPIVVISDDEAAQAIGEAFVTVLHERGWFVRSANPPQRAQFYECMRKTGEPEGCIRGSATWKGKGAAVVVLVSGSPEQDWKCIGVAATPRFPDRQAVRIQVQQGIFGTAEQQRQEQYQAGECIIAAVAESGW